MPKFYVYELVPVYINYRKTVEAESEAEALEIAQDDWSAINSDETTIIGDPIEELLPVTYEAEPAPEDDKPLPAKPKVVVEVYGGVAEVTQCPAGVDVEIIDHDNLKAEGRE